MTATKFLFNFVMYPLNVTFTDLFYFVSIPNAMIFWLYQEIKGHFRLKKKQ